MTTSTRASARPLDGWVRFYDEKYGPRVGTVRYDAPAARAARRLELAARRAGEDAERDAAKKVRLVATLRDDCGGRVMSDAELRGLDGFDGRGLALAIGGHVLDVSKSLYLYGPSASRDVRRPRHHASGGAAQGRRRDGRARGRHRRLSNSSCGSPRAGRVLPLKVSKIALLELIATHGLRTARQPQGE